MPRGTSVRLVGVSCLVFASLVFASGASAQVICGEGRPPCGSDGACVRLARLDAGVCVPLACGSSATPAILEDRCFGEGATIADAFASGDCDGDLVPNGRDSGGSLCDGAAVIGLELTGTGPRWTWYERQRLDQDGEAIAPYDAHSLAPHALGIGCQRGRPCPTLPSAPRELASRCVLMTTPTAPGADAIGVCTYYHDDRLDDSCLSNAFDAARCLERSAGAEPHVVWEHGDCDQDGLINKLDPYVCAQLEVLGVSAGDTICAPGIASVDSSMCGSDLREVSPEHSACTRDTWLLPFSPFALCCRTGRDCPASRDLGSASRARCVTLAYDGSMRPVGACTYDETLRADDSSCLTSSGSVRDACFAGEPSYGAWAGGDCDGCDGRANHTDDVVCGPCADAGTGLDAGVDAAISPRDAASSAEDVGPLDAAPEPDADLDAWRADAATRVPGSFAGSGCRCGIASHPRSHSRAPWLLSLVLALLRPLLRRRDR